MRRSLISILKKPIVIGSIVSILLFILILLLKVVNPTILEIDSKWLILAGVPLLVALLTGGYIQHFKGLGIEIESALARPMEDLPISRYQFLSLTGRDEKRTIQYLDSLSDQEKNDIQVLQFIEGPATTGPDYSTYAILDYRTQLRRLKYLEIRDQNKKFLCLLPVSILGRGLHRGERDGDWEKANRFITSLLTNTVRDNYSHRAITSHIPSDITLLEAYRQIKRTGNKIAAIINPENDVIGVVSETELARWIAERVASVN